MMTVTIPEPYESADDLAAALEYIAGLIREGNTSGYHPRWELTESE